MSDRENLAGALAGFVDLEPDEAVECSGSELLPIIAAAEKWYAQLPETCGTCGGDGSPIVGYPCKDCHGRGTVYPPETVERIAAALLDHSIEQGFMLAKFREVQRRNAAAEAVAVLDALNE